ncbi:unnamed protein product [Cunninghamella blakesleeana]
MTTYTFFREKSGGSARVYCGTFEREEQVNQPIAFRIGMTSMMSELYDGNNIEIPILKATYLNKSKNKAMIEGFNTGFEMKNSGLMSEKWKWSDPFNKNKAYQWKIDFFGLSWKLKDVDHGTILASFERADLSIKKQGVLTIYYRIAPYLLSFIILSHKIVHQSVKNEEVEAITESADAFSSG